MQYPRRKLLLSAGVLAGWRIPLARAQGANHILVVGDSQAQGLAGGLVRQYRHDRSIQIDDRSHIASGLLSPNRYNWPEEIVPIANGDRDALAVVMFGANDRPLVRSHGDIDPKKTAEFRNSYGAKVKTIAETLKHDCRSVIWVGHPIVRDTVYAEDMTLLNDVYQTQAVAAGAVWFPSWPIFSSEDGAYDAYGKGIDGQTTRLRADDGVHLTPAGYDVLARALMPIIATNAVPPPATPS
jgi:hypothetical protein